jgi:glycosyltransferase involved in cell wall biosynthesis
MANQETNLFKSLFYQREFKKLKKQEISSWQKQDAVFATSRRDCDMIGKSVSETDTFVIPNGVNTDFFYPSNRNLQKNTLVFTGTMNYVPNEDAMLYFIKDILPLIRQEIPDIQLYVVGNNPPERLRKLSSGHVTVTGFVDDVRPYIHQAPVYVVPLRMGGGTRLKILESLATKTPVVSTKIGAEGIDVTDGEDILLEEDPESFAAAVITLLKNKKKRKKIARKGYELVKQKYDWKVIGSKIERAYQQLQEQVMDKEPRQDPALEMR